jgi:hypothetical protein
MAEFPATSKKVQATPSLIPAFSPRRRRIVRRLSEKPETEFAERSSAKPKPDCGYFLSSGRG